MSNTNTFCISGTTVSFVNNEERNVNCDWLKHKFRHYGVFYRMLNTLSDNDFTVSKDSDVHKRLQKDYYTGRKNELKFVAHKYPKGFKIEFYQDINHENPHGGKYDFDKFDKMPYMIQKQFQLTVSKISEFLSQFAENNTKPVLKTAEDKIKYDYVKSCHHPQTDMNFNLSDLNGTTCEYDYNNKDRDRKTLHNGDFKYFRDYNGYLYSGHIYHNLNSMWYVILNDSEIRNKAGSELFDLSENDTKNRLKKHNPPESYVQRKNILSECSDKELKNELKKRRMKKSAGII